MSISPTIRGGYMSVILASRSSVVRFISAMKLDGVYCGGNRIDKLIWEKRSCVAVHRSCVSCVSLSSLLFPPAVLTFSGALGALSILVSFPGIDEVAAGRFLGLLIGKWSSVWPDMFVAGSLACCSTVSNGTTKRNSNPLRYFYVRALSSVTLGVVATETEEDRFWCFDHGNEYKTYFEGVATPRDRSHIDRRRGHACMVLPLDRNRWIHVVFSEHEKVGRRARIPVSFVTDGCVLICRSLSCLSSHPWEVMAQAAYRKYPNPQNPNVKALDVLERRAEREKGRKRLFSHRLFTTLWNVPLIVLQVSIFSQEWSVCVLWCCWSLLLDCRDQPKHVHPWTVCLRC